MHVCDLQRQFREIYFPSVRENEVAPPTCAALFSNSAEIGIDFCQKESRRVAEISREGTLLTPDV